MTFLPLSVPNRKRELPLFRTKNTVSPLFHFFPRVSLAGFAYLIGYFVYFIFFPTRNCSVLGHAHVFSAFFCLVFVHARPTLRQLKTNTFFLSEFGGLAVRKT